LSNLQKSYNFTIKLNGAFIGARERVRHPLVHSARRSYGSRVIEPRGKCSLRCKEKKIGVSVDSWPNYKTVKTRISVDDITTNDDVLLTF